MIILQYLLESIIRMETINIIQEKHIIFQVYYEDYDEYGNWHKKIKKINNREKITYREINFFISNNTQMLIFLKVVFLMCFMTRKNKSFMWQQ